jgi:hypothetical protein
MVDNSSGFDGSTVKEAGALTVSQMGYMLLDTNIEI